MWDRSCRRTRIKLCEFESLDASYEASRMDVDALGFHIFKHQDVREKVGRFAEILRHLPPLVSRTLLTDLEMEVLAEVLAALPVDTVQLYPDWGGEEIERLRGLVGRDFKILKVLSAQPSENFTNDTGEFLDYYRGAVEGFLLDSWRIGGTGRTADWGHCAEVVRVAGAPVFLAGGLTAENVEAAILQVRPFGVDVENGVSDRIPNGPLVKNMRKCREFVEAVRRADKLLLGASEVELALPRRKGDAE